MELFEWTFFTLHVSVITLFSPLLSILCFSLGAILRISTCHNTSDHPHSDPQNSNPPNSVPLNSSSPNSCPLSSDPPSSDPPSSSCPNNDLLSSGLPSNGLPGSSPPSNPLPTSGPSCSDSPNSNSTENSLITVQESLQSVGMELASVASDSHLVLSRCWKDSNDIDSSSSSNTTISESGMDLNLLISHKLSCLFTICCYCMQILCCWR